MPILDDLLTGRPASDVWSFGIGDVSFQARSDDPSLLAAARDLTGSLVGPPGDGAVYTIWTLDGLSAPELPPGADYVLPNGRTKETFFDAASGERLVRKKKTGLWCLFSGRQYLIGGDVRENLNQWVNIVNNIFMMQMQSQGFLVLQTAALVVGDTAFALAGRSGSGKTTTMFKLLAEGGTFVTNDRLLLRWDPDRGDYEMVGVPKWPRVNAGTMMADPRLRELVPETQQRRYAAMSFDRLFEVDEKYDVDVASLYGPGRVSPRCRSRRIYYLDWSRTGTGFELVPAPRDEPGFWGRVGPDLYRDAGPYARENTGSRFGPEVADRYRQALSRADLFFVRGRLDFDRVGGAILGHLNQP